MAAVNKQRARHGNRAARRVLDRIAGWLLNIPVYNDVQSVDVQFAYVQIVAKLILYARFNRTF